MNYRHRIMESKLKTLAEHFPVVVVTGARQVGKSTLVSHLFGNNARNFVFDPVTDEHGARRDPQFFLQQYPPPLILDEIQFAPELVTLIKKQVDKDKRPGQYFLTGSQNLSIIKTISESMAGRAVVVDVEGMTVSERSGTAKKDLNFWIEAILASGKRFESLNEFNSRPKDQKHDSLFTLLWRGGYPGTLDLPNELFADYFRSFVRTYVERDIRVLAEVSNQQTFSRFFSLVAVMTAQEINHSQLGRELGVTPQTASRWLNILQATFQWFELPPYHGNLIKRLSTKGKGYLTDTGLACFLSHISSPETLAVQPNFGSLFETHVVLEIKRMFSASSKPVHLYHWRAHSGAEVDLVIERDGLLWPVEIKSKANITASDCRGIHAFRETYARQCGTGIIVASVDEPCFFSKEIVVLPYSLCSP